ncbi:hypothetical protein GINT2_001102 [Glugoides intestinalis]
MRAITLTIGISILSIFFIYGTYFKINWIIQDSITLFNKLIMLVINCKTVNTGTKKMHDEPHVYVSNHTSFIDYLVMSSYKFSHASISEGNNGLGFFLTHILSKNGSIWFKRSDRRDRNQVLKKIKEHTKRKMSPMIIFPEGTCVNNESIVLFQKGAFELDALICPVGIKYKKDFMDPYWNRRVHGFVLHFFYLLTRWGIEAEVHWMEPMRKEEKETSLMFSHRVKNAIALEMNLRNTLWNGYFKSSPVLKDREMLKKCFLSVYWKMKEDLLPFEAINDIHSDRFYLLNENIDTVEKDDKVYFDRLTYKRYVNECCKEYLRIKGGNVQD